MVGQAFILWIFASVCRVSIGHQDSGAPPLCANTNAGACDADQLRDGPIEAAIHFAAAARENAYRRAVEESDSEEIARLKELTRSLLPRNASQALAKGWHSVVRKAVTTVFIDGRKHVGTYTGVRDGSERPVGIGNFTAAAGWFSPGIVCERCSFVDGVALEARLKATRLDCEVELHGQLERGHFTGTTDAKGRPHGAGTFTELHGVRWEGAGWRHGVLEGPGRSFYSSGALAYEGGWKGGKRDGGGKVFHWSDGTGGLTVLQHGRFENDRFQGKK